MRSLQFTWNEIASLLNVSSKTLQRRAKEWNIEKYSADVDDDTLDQIVQEIKSQFPRSGEVIIRGHLNSQKDRLSKFISLHHCQHHNRKKYAQLIKVFCV